MGDLVLDGDLFLGLVGDFDLSSAASAVSEGSTEVLRENVFDRVFEIL